MPGFVLFEHRRTYNDARTHHRRLVISVADVRACLYFYQERKPGPKCQMINFSLPVCPFLLLRCLLPLPLSLVSIYFDVVWQIELAVRQFQTAR